MYQISDWNRDMKYFLGATGKEIIVNGTFKRYVAIHFANMITETTMVVEKLYVNDQFSFEKTLDSD